MEIFLLITYNYDFIILQFYNLLYNIGTHDTKIKGQMDTTRILGESLHVY